MDEFRIRNHDRYKIGISGLFGFAWGTRQMKKATQEEIETLTQLVTMQFRSFGGGQDVSNSNNPISHALKDKKASFAAGVDVHDVVKYVLHCYNYGLPKKIATANAAISEAATMGESKQ